MQTLEFRAMNTSVLMAAEGPGSAAAGLQEARAFIDDCELRFSRFLPESELSRMNQNAGDWQPISGDLMDMLSQSLRYYRQTEGLFDPSILPDLKRAGYDRSMDELLADGAGAAGGRLGKRRSKHPAFAEIELDQPNGQVRLPPGMEIDLGGIAKGWIVQKAAALLSTFASICAVSAGGDICFVGMPSDGSKWRVELEDPRNPKQSIAVLQVGACAVVTSSVAKRTWNQEGRRQHHLIDPRTGSPAKSRWLSVTVVGPDILAAEVYAKAILIGGDGQAARVDRNHPELAYITIDPQGRLSGSQTSREYLDDFNPLYHAG